MNNEYRLKVRFLNGSEKEFEKWFLNQNSTLYELACNVVSVDVTDNGNIVFIDVNELDETHLFRKLFVPKLVDILHRWCYHVYYVRGGNQDESVLSNGGDDTISNLLDELDIDTTNKKEKKDEDKKDEEEHEIVGWYQADNWQKNYIQKLIVPDQYEIFFILYTLADYLGNDNLCQVMTDIWIQKCVEYNLTSPAALTNKLVIPNAFPSQKQNMIYNS